MPFRPHVFLATLAIAALPCLAGAAAIGRFGGPYIGGTVRPGDFDQVQREWAQEPFDRPLRLRIGTDSGTGLELARLGAWVRERRPVIHLERDCVDACARDLLPAGRAWLADRDVLIAFSSVDDWPLVLKQALDDGRLFLDDQGASAESKARFVKQYRPFWEDAHAVQTLRASLPEPAQSFLDKLTRPTAVSAVSFMTTNARLKLEHSVLGCMAWLPDAAGLKQLGIDLPNYKPPERADAAKRLKLPAERLYIGAMPDTPPTQPLCEGGAVELGERAR